jgi:hypothetical protein
MFLRHQRPHGEKFVTAGIAAQRRQTGETPYESGPARHVLGRNSLQIRVPAVTAVRVKRKTERNRPGLKAQLTGFTAPRQHSRAAEEIVHERTPLGATYLRGMTAGASNGQRLGLRYFR